ncbi:MAG: glycosyltransferase family 39 protein [Patescibacteria group bacterium]
MLSWKALKNYLPLILIILLASILRLFMLGDVPISMSDDEIRAVYSSYSIAHTGRDAFGNFLPVVIKLDGSNTFGQVPIYLSSLFFLFLDLNPFTARLPYALAGILSIVFFYFIVKKIFNDGIAIASSFVFAVSVWHIQLSRFAIETDTTLLLYLIGIHIFLYAQNKTIPILVSMFSFFLAFYSYSAMKVTFLPLLLILTWYKYKELSKKHLLIILSTIILAFGSFGLLSITQNASSYSGAGGNFFFFQDKEKTALVVELERRGSQEPEFVKSFYHNKFTYWIRMFSSNYLAAFSPGYLFLNQEGSGIYSIWERGVLYLFELPLLIIGFIYLFLKKRKEFFFVLFLLLIAPLPSALGVGAPTWTSRSAFMIFGLYIFIGAGIYSMLTLFKKQQYRYFIFLAFVFLYLYSVSGYLFQYYYDWSSTNAKYFSKSTQDLVYFINKSKRKDIVVSGATVNTFFHYAFYNKIDPAITHKIINNSQIKYENVVFIQICFIDTDEDPYKSISQNQIYIAISSCKYKAKPKTQIRVHNGEEIIWNIFEK